MSRNYQTDAINIKSYNLSDNDKIIVMYSKEHGIIRAVAKGVKKPKSKLGGRMDLLVNNNLLLAKGKNLDIVSQAEVINGFNNIRTDIFKVSFASYCAELINVFGIEEDTNCEKIYLLLNDTLSEINTSKGKLNILKPVINFQIQLMNIIGYGLSINNCASCGKTYEKGFSFSLSSGGIVCPNCNGFSYSNKNTQKTVEILKNPYNCDNLKDLEEIFNLLEKYISMHSHKKIKSTDFLAAI